MDFADENSYRLYKQICNLNSIINLINKISKKNKWWIRYTIEKSIDNFGARWREIDTDKIIDGNSVPIYIIFLLMVTDGLSAGSI